MVARDPEDIEPLRAAIEAGREAGLSEQDLGPAAQLLRKLEADSAPLTFTDIPRQEMERLQAVTSREQAVAILMQSFGISPNDGFQSEVLAEFHYASYMYCQKHRYSAEKASTFLSIMKRLHAHAVVEHKLTETEARGLFETLIQRHSRQLPPFSVGVFSLEEASTVRDYASRHFFRYYSMHAYVYTRRQDLSVRAIVETLVPKVPHVTQLHPCFEVDPREVPELKELFPSLEAAPTAPAGRAAAAGGAGHRGKPAAAPEAAVGVGSGDGGAAAGALLEKPEADVLKAIDEAIQARLGFLDSLLQLPPS